MAGAESREADPTQQLQSLFHALDPVSLLLSHYQICNAQPPLPLRLTAADSFFVERGPRYGAYADLRESRLRLKTSRQHQSNSNCKQNSPPPPRKHVKFSPIDLSSSRKGRAQGHSLLAQSVPDFSASVRKENRKPGEMRGGKKNLGGRGGSQSASPGEKTMGRKSCAYATVAELKSISLAAASAIHAEDTRPAPTSKTNTIPGYYYRHL